MKNKFLLHGTTTLWLQSMIVVCMALVSCQPKYDPMASIEKLADKNIPAKYSLVWVDTAKMLSNVQEYELLKDGSGSMLQSVSGNNQDITSISQSLVWWRGDFVEKNTYVNVFATLESGETHTMLWGSRALVDGDLCMTQGSKYSLIKAIYDQFGNSQWQAADSTWFSVTRNDTLRYLEWNQAKGNDAKLTQAQVDEKKAYFAQQWVKDTIEWYNVNFRRPQKLSDIPDSIKVGTKVGSKYMCVFYIGTETMKVTPVVKHLGDKVVTNSQFALSRDAAFANKGMYCYHYFTQDTAHLVDPTAANANAKDSLYQLDIKEWCIGNPTSSSGFEIVAKGNMKHVVWQTVNGHCDTLLKVSQSDWLQTFVITGHYAKDVAVIDGISHKYVK